AIAQVNTAPAIVAAAFDADRVEVGKPAQLDVILTDVERDLTRGAGTFVDWGDGSRSTDADLLLDLVKQASKNDRSLRAIHSYAAAGTYAVSVGLADDFGAATKLAVGSITVVNPDPGATPTGSGVTVTPVDPATGTTPVSLSFGNVTSGGSTSVTTSGTGTPPSS